MAITGIAKGIGGTTLTGLYIRIKNVDIAKDDDGWILAYNVEAFLDASKAGQSGYSVPLADIQSAAVRSENEITDPFGLAYADLKTRSVITDAVDV
jgi:hypothetical protein|tara:strand:+ start:750 stop:1037 length:288 start_codon:yes stop_codon:yes gene_type:complete